jgi:hypothetical protein
MIDRICQFCGKQFRVRPSWIKAGGGKFCSRACHNLSQCKSKSIRADGYVMLKMPEHPRANRWGFVYEHIVAAEKLLGRPLKKGEIVHHKDRTPGNNDDSSNFTVLASQSDHARLHAHERAIARGITDPTNFRRCAVCKQIKSVDNFSPSTDRGRPSRASYCKPCAAAYRRQDSIRRAAKAANKES